MTMLTRPGSTLLPDVFNMFDIAWPFPGRHPVHIEEFIEQQTYVVRAELPGLDPARDIELQASEGALTISAERREDRHEQHRSEFRYGSFMRTIALPSGADTEAIEAKYDKGILEIRVPLRAKAQERKVPIDVTES